MEIIRFAILGLGVGAVYVLIAQGVVLIYRGSGVLNFAQGAVAMIAAYSFYDLRSYLPLPVALAVAIGLAATIGIVMQWLVLRNMKQASPLARIVATLGLLTLLAGIGQLRWGTTNRPVEGFLPDHVIDFGGGVVISADRIWLLVVAVVLTALLHLIYSRTRFGLATSAVAENQRAAMVLGWSPDLLSVVNWGVGSALAGLAGILLAPLSGLVVTGLVFMVIPALAAALVGQFKSFGLTLAGGLLIGVGQSEVTRFVDQAGWSDAVPLLLVVALMMVRGRSLPLRGELGDEPPRVGVGFIRPVVAIPFVVLGIGLVLMSDVGWQLVLSTTAVAGLVALSLIIVTGYAGQLSLAQLMIAGVGAVAAGNASSRWDWPFPLCVLFGGLVAVIVGLAVAVPSLRVRGVNLAVVTLGLAVVIQTLVIANGDLTMFGQLMVNPPTLFGAEVSYLTHPERYALMVTIVLILACVLTANIRRGSSGRRYLALRSNERAASSCGINVFAGKTYAFGISAFLAGIAGALSAFQFPFVNLAQFDSLSSINLLVQNMIGGIGYIASAVGAGAAMPGGAMSHVFEEIGLSAQYVLIFGGAFVLFTLWHDPHGIMDTTVRQMGSLFKWVPERDVNKRIVKDLEAFEPTGGGPHGQTLEVRDLSVRFGGVKAVSHLNLRVEPGEVLGLIGPNGAGKTTVMDAVSGMVISTGHVAIASRPIQSRSPARRSAAGLARTFQAVELFGDLTVLDNIRIAAESRHVSTYLTDAIFPRRIALPDVAKLAIHELGLLDHLTQKASELPLGKQKLVGIARALATEPSVLLLDEPAAGIGGEESRELGRLIRRLADEWGLTVLLIEHDVELVTSISDRVVAMALGEEIAEGKPTDVLASPAVVTSYMGEVEEPALSAGAIGMEVARR